MRRKTVQESAPRMRAAASQEVSVVARLIRVVLMTNGIVICYVSDDDAGIGVVQLQGSKEQDHAQGRRDTGNAAVARGRSLARPFWP